MPTALELNHAMVYTHDLARSLAFYKEQLGFELLEEFIHGGRPVYARLLVPGSQSTIALHLQSPSQPMQTGGVRLYFEVRSLTSFCRKLEAAGVVFSKPPAKMPWGWTHAYLDDPDGHEISLYWAGAKRLKKSK